MPTIIPTTIIVRRVPVVRIVPAPTKTPIVPADVTVVVWRVPAPAPAVPRIVPSIIVPIIGVAQAETAIACQAGRVGEVTIRKTIVVSIGIAFVVTFTLGR